MDLTELNFSDHESYTQVSHLDKYPFDANTIIEDFLTSPKFHQLQVFNNQAIRIIETSNSKYLYVSESMEELTGYSSKEIEDGGLTLMFKCIHRMDVIHHTATALKIKQAFRKLSPEEKMSARYTYTLRFICKNGTIKKILQNCLVLKLNMNHDPLVLLYTSTDNTEYKQDNQMTYSLSVNKNGIGFVNIVKGSAMEHCPLTLRELEVLQQTSKGYSEKQIADNLSLSIETIKTHRRNMLQKVNVKNAMELVRLAISKNWI